MGLSVNQSEPKWQMRLCLPVLKRKHLRTIICKLLDVSIISYHINKSYVQVHNDFIIITTTCIVHDVSTPTWHASDFNEKEVNNAAWRQLAGAYLLVMVDSAGLILWPHVMVYTGLCFNQNHGEASEIFLQKQNASTKFTFLSGF